MSKFLFGPILSRRLGLSLGIDLIPFKASSTGGEYNGNEEKSFYKREAFFDFKDIIKEINDVLKKNPKFDYITISGSGEPTFSTNLGPVITFIKKNYPQYNVALITNSILLHLEDVRSEIRNLDLLIPSLDAATQGVLDEITSKSFKIEIKVESIIEGIKECVNYIKGETWLEIFIIPGINDSVEELKEIRHAINYIQPNKVQLNTIERMGSEDIDYDLKQQEKKRVEDILGINFISKIDIDGEEFTQDEMYGFEDVLLKTIQNRPYTIQELAKKYRKPIGVVGEILQTMKYEKKVYEKVINGMIYYVKSNLK